MDLSRFTTEESGTPSLGVIDDQQETITEINTAATTLDGALQNDETWNTLLSDADGKKYPLEEISLLAPVDRPTNLIGVGLNYVGHAEEGGHDIPEKPIFFSKSPSSITASGSNIVRHEGVTNLHWEGEFGVVVGETVRNLDAEEAAEAIFGYVIGNDVTARDMQAADLDAANPWFRSKSMDTFTPLGPWVTPTGEGVDPDNADIKTEVNGEIVQSSNTSDLIFSIPEALSYISQYVTLQPGDVVLTGTPAGVGEMEPGDSVSVAVEGIGELSNKVTGP